jgi:NAD(P)-dependent dehydrogenase (short-subunit alcohol dehydrogenase family)
MPVALITGASLGLGRALATELAHQGWSLVVDGRRAELLDDLLRELEPDRITALPGDVADPEHRAGLLAAVQRHGRLDLLVNNASRLGPSPQPHLRDFPLDELSAVYEVDVLAPIALIQLHHQLLVASAGTIVNISSDAGAQAYEGWGGYGSAKAALEQASAVLAVEEAALKVYAFDPGDMRTEMHQQAFPGEDISDLPDPGSVVPALLGLVESRPASGRYRAGDLLAPSDPTSLGVAGQRAADPQAADPRAAGPGEAGPEEAEQREDHR